jgi:hypothetical protein
MRIRGYRACLTLLVALSVGACDPAPGEKSESAPRVAPANVWSLFVSRQSVKDAFDRQAAIDKTDRTIAECVDVHAVMSCGFVIGAFARDVPEEAGSLTEMPDEVLDIAGLNSEFVSNIDLDGNGSTPARRFHYLGQFKTLMRVLSPEISAADLDRLIEDLQLGATPQKELHTALARPFAHITCTQGGGASAYIHCQTGQ